MVQNSTIPLYIVFICWIPKYGSKFDKIENEYTKARGIFYDLSDFASGRCRKPGPEPTEPRKQKNYSEPLSEYGANTHLPGIKAPPRPYRLLLHLFRVCHLFFGQASLGRKLQPFTGYPRYNFGLLRDTILDCFEKENLDSIRYTV